jgi:ABC-2 type transport system permease protein
MISLAFKNFIRTRAVITGLLLLFCTGIISLYIGKQYLDKQQQDIAEVDAWQQDHIKRQTAYNKEMGLLLYYLRFTIVNQTAPINGLTIGQRDINPSIKSLTIRNLEAQQYDTGLYNPTNLLLGNLDFGFVLLYLFPLLIIACTFNTWSGEKENGTWPLLAIQSGRPRLLLLKLFALRSATVFVVYLLLLAAAVVILDLPLNSALLAFISMGSCYLLCWMAISCWVVSWQQRSAVNAVSLLAIWVTLTIVAPAAINNYLINQYPVPEALETAVQQRKGYHEKWDMDKGITMDKFYAHYPQFKKYTLPDAEFSWLWYYAMQQMGDDDAQQASRHLKNKLYSREKAGEQLSLFIPTLHTQWQMNNLAQSGLGNYLSFLDSAARFHENKRLYFYPKIFDNTPVNQEDWNKIQVTTHTNVQPINWTALLLPLLISTALLLCLSSYHLRKINSH